MLCHLFLHYFGQCVNLLYILSLINGIFFYAVKKIDKIIGQNELLYIRAVWLVFGI
jgi:hypothetical protein